MAQRYVYSDPHFGHSGIRYIPGNEQFRDGTIEERDEKLIENWNSVVNKRDVVYLLGDIGWDKPQGYVTHGIIPRLAGRIEVLGGNHDTAEILTPFDKVHGVIVKTVNNAHCIFTHIPIHPQEMWWDYNLHGHLHTGTVKKYAHTKDMRDMGERDPRYINVCGEHLGFTPQLLEDVVPDQHTLVKRKRRH